MKKILSLVLTIFLLLSITILANAQEPPFVLDEANLLEDYQIQELTDILKSTSDELQFGIYIVTKEDIDDDIESYTDDFYDYNGYGYGENKDGVMLLLNMNERELHVTTTGDDYIYTLQDYVNEMIDSFIDNLGNDDYYQGFLSFIKYTSQLVEDIQNGEIITAQIEDTNNWNEDENFYFDDDYYDYNYYPYQSRNLSTTVFIIILLSIVFSLLTCLYLKSKNKSVRFSKNADRYENPESFNITYHSDRFMYRTINKTAKADDNNHHSGGGHSGGGGIHVGSSGTSHGGGSSHF